MSIDLCMYAHTHTHTALAVHGKSITPPPRVNVKELAKLYKQRSLESLGRGRKGKLKCPTVYHSMLVRICPSCWSCCAI